MDVNVKVKEFNLVVAGEQDMGRRKGERDLAALQSLQNYLTLETMCCETDLSKNEV